VANWISPADARDTRSRGRHARDYAPHTYGSNAASAFAFRADDDDEFSLVDSRGGAARRVAVRALGRPDMRGRGRGRGGMQRLGRGGMGGARGGAGGLRKRFRWRDADRAQAQRVASVRPTDAWALVQDIEFSRMAGLSFVARDARDLGRVGRAGVYDHAYDRVTARLEKPLRAAGAVRYNASASDDPVLAAAHDSARVFATDSVLAALMAATVSTGAWDVVANRVGDSLYLDKRDGGPLDFPSVNENAAEPPADSGDKDAAINLAPTLASEARDVTANYIRQVTAAAAVDYAPNPFSDGAAAPDDCAYRYRLLDFSARRRVNPDDSDSDAEEELVGDRCLVAVRTEVSGLLPSGPQTHKQLFIRALTQHDIAAPGAGGALDWRQKLDAQRGAVVATEMKNNASKLARWAFQAILAGADQLRIGFVARVSPRDRTRHAILGHQSYNPSDFVSQLGLNEFNAWGILKALIDLCLRLDEGKYVIMRDPNKPLIQLYRVPPNSFEDNDSDNDDDNEKPDPAANA
ncbi:hypothetical protein H4S02_001204, partial [Coemansia sp. RSA 2611]